MGKGIDNRHVKCCCGQKEIRDCDLGLNFDITNAKNKLIIRVNSHNYKEIQTIFLDKDELTEMIEQLNEYKNQLK